MSLLSLGQMAASGSVNANPLDLAVAQEYITTDQFTQLLPARPVTGIHNRYRRETERPLTKYHHVGGTICEGVAKYQTITDEMGRIICQIPLDIKVERSSNLVSAYADQLRSARWEFVEKWGDSLINGSGQTSPSSDDGEIRGLATLATALPASQKYTPSTSPAGTGISFIHLDKLRKRVQYRPDFFLMPEDVLIDLKVQFQSLGGVEMSQVMRPFTVFDGGSITIQERPVPAYSGIPIFVSDHIHSESTNGGDGKYRVYCGSFEAGKGLETFYDPRNGFLGFEVNGPFVKESADETFIRVRHMMGLSLRSSLALSYMTNVKIVNPA